MKNIKRKAFSLISISTLALALASCDKNRNTKTPTDASFDLNKTYASVGDDLQITYNDMYNAYRSNGYDTVIKQLKKKMVASYLDEVTYTSYTKQLNTSILSNVYGATDIASFNEGTSEELKALKKKVDSFVKDEYTNYGVIISKGDANFLKDLVDVLSNRESIDDAIDFTGHTDLLNTFVEQYKYSIALTNLAREYVNKFANDEKIYSYDDDKEVANTYYVDEDQVKSSFESTYYKYNQTKAIVVRFNTYAEGERFVKKTNEKVGALTDENKLTWYATLFNLYNEDKKAIDTTSPFNESGKDLTVFYEDATKTTLSNKYSSELVTFIKEDLDDGQYLSSLRNIDGSYYLVYRDSVNYYYGDGSGNDFDTVKNLTLADLKKTHTDFNEFIFKDYKDKEMADTTTVYDYIRAKLVDSKASESLGDTLVTDKIKHNLELKIYDPVFENQFYNSYSDYYSFTKEFDGSKVFTFKYTDDKFTHSDSSDDTTVEGSISVDEFFNEMDKKNSHSTATTLLERKFVLNTSLADLCTSDEIDGFKTAAKDAIKAFKKGDTSYSKKMGVENYLTLTYGLPASKDSEAQLTDYLKAESLISKYNTYYGYQIDNSDSENPSFKDSGLFANFKTFADKTQDKYYDISANHFLISVDPEKTGTHADPRSYIASLDKADETGELTKEFKQAVLELSKIIAEESKLIAGDSKDSLSSIAKAYNNTGYTFELNSSYAKELGIKNFDEFKEKYYKFNFTITAEDLGEITASSVNSFVTEFKDFIEDKIIATMDEDTKTLINKDGKMYTPEKYDDLCLTVYGYHVLNVYKQTDSSSAKFTYDDDTKSSSESYKTWEHQKVTVALKKSNDDRDDLIAYASGYSDDKYVSTEQLFIYFYTSQNGSVSGLKSNISTVVKTYFGDTYSKYTNSSMASFRLLEQMLGYENIVKGTYTDNVYNQDLTFSSIKFYDIEGNLSDKTNTYSKYVYNVTYAVSSGDEFKEGSVFNDWFNTDWTVDLQYTNLFHYDN
ncbi:MAG: hypothetical protein K6G28_06990 [Acholeplasmatales bacterium]|nr:hypothetical protein [Acholeplasmatales bacterium]